jgi:hypothetical protein
MLFNHRVLSLHPACHPSASVAQFHPAPVVATSCHKNCTSCAEAGCASACHRVQTMHSSNHRTTLLTNDPAGMLWRAAIQKLNPYHVQLHHCLQLLPWMSLLLPNRVRRRLWRPAAAGATAATAGTVPQQSTFQGFVVLCHYMQWAKAIACSRIYQHSRLLPSASVDGAAVTAAQSRWPWGATPESTQ